MDEKKASMLSGALVEGVHGGQSSEPESLRAKIQQGILALQEGLLERGTEVSHPALLAVIEAFKNEVQVTVCDLA